MIRSILNPNLFTVEYSFRRLVIYFTFKELEPEIIDCNTVSYMNWLYDNRKNVERKSIVILRDSFEFRVVCLMVIYEHCFVGVLVPIVNPQILIRVLSHIGELDVLFRFFNSNYISIYQKSSSEGFQISRRFFDRQVQAHARVVVQQKR